MENLSSVFAKAQCYALNEQPGHSFTNLFVGDHTLYLQSDADEQLIITIAFNQTVQLKQIQFGLPGDESCPQTVKLFINQQSLGFSDASETVPTQVITLSPPDDPTKPVVHNLSAAKWNRVDSVTFFVEDNHGAPQTVMHGLKLFGTTVQGTDVSSIHKKRQEE